MGKAASGLFKRVDRSRLATLNLCALVLLALPVAADTVTVVALGDSLTQGYGLPPQDGFVPQLQRYLDAAGADVALLNAGVSGDTTAGGLSRIDWTLNDEVDAVIVALGGNDVLRGLPPEQARANLDAILERINAKELPTLLVGIDAPANFGAAYEDAFEAIYPDLAQKHDVLLFKNFLEGLAALDDLSFVMQNHMQADGIHPDASGVALIVEAIGPSVLQLVEAARD
jgi:acyl-CoA thioesterase-1